jgi:hypothetical protein
MQVPAGLAAIICLKIRSREAALSVRSAVVALAYNCSGVGWLYLKSGHAAKATVLKLEATSAGQPGSRCVLC